MTNELFNVICKSLKETNLENKFKKGFPAEVFYGKYKNDFDKHDLINIIQTIDYSICHCYGTDEDVYQYLYELFIISFPQCYEEDSYDN